MHLRSKHVSHNRRSQQSKHAGLWAIVWVYTCTVPVLHAQDVVAVMEDSVAKIVEKSEAAVVSIARVKQIKEESFHQDIGPFRNFHQKPTYEDFDVLPNEFGAGVLISLPKSSERLVLTSMHVVRGGPIYSASHGRDHSQLRARDGTELWVHFSDRRRCRAGIIAADPRSDLAALRIDWDEAGFEPTEYPALDWQSAQPLRKGQFVVLFGNPYAIARDGSASVSWGIISNLTRQPAMAKRSRRVDHEEIAERSMLNRLGTLMQLDSRMNLGSSGGAVLNLKGELIGIATSLAAIEGYEQSSGFAFPIDTLTRRIVQSLLEGREVEYGMIGIEPAFVAPHDFAELRTGLRQQTAAKVLTVSNGSPAKVVGIEPEDVIVAVEGDTVYSEVDLMRMVGLHPPGRSISMTIWRKNGRLAPENAKLTENGKLAQVKVRLGKWPVRDEEGIIETNPRYAPWRGLSVDYSTSRSFALGFLPTNSTPVLVTKVAENSPSQVARLQPGDCIVRVNDTTVQTPAEFYAAVKTIKGAARLTLLDLSEPANRNDFQGNPKVATRTVQVGE